jgi:hypothetical protein
LGDGGRSICAGICVAGIWPNEFDLW